MGVVNIDRLTDLDLSYHGLRLALNIARRAVPATGLCHCSNSEYAERLHISKDHVSRLIQMLCRNGLVYRMGPRTVLVNPSWCFRGTPAQQNEAVAEWSRLHPFGVVARQQSAA